MDFTPSSFEQKWRSYWKENKTYQVPNESDKPKFYVLDMFPYPSGAGLHVGHPLGYIASDIFSRYKRMKGFNVLHPMGYDAFGLPAEQYAIQTGVHPETSTYKNIERYREQLDNIGFSFDWDREVRTCAPDYYKWTQWIFIQLFEHYYDKAADKAMPITDLITAFAKNGSNAVKASHSNDDDFTAAEWTAFSAKEKDRVLMNYRMVYRKEMSVNWCEALGTVLANDEVKDGFSERGGHPVVKRPMMQWALRTTAYAQRLLDGLDTVDWTDSLKAQQRNWIGRSEGARLFFDLVDSDAKIEVFTTRLDTIFGVTFMVIAPEHDLVAQITTKAHQGEIDAYLEYVQSRSERERTAEVKTVTGAFTGAYATNPYNGDKIPVYISEYVLKDYGTGAIMAVPSDDDRDQKFAEKFGLPIIDVIDKSKYPDATLHDKVGILINSAFLNGMEVPEAIEAAVQKAEELGIGSKEINYRLRDAGYSRQRYWGEPFPIAYDLEGVAHVIPMDDLPVELPALTNYLPTPEGKSPLSRLNSWVNLPKGWTRETDTMPGYAGSSWYFLRYMDANNPDALVGEKAINYWENVDLYVGGTEHAVGHLLYSRTWHKFLHDLGIVKTKEPFKKLVNQGMIQGRSSFVYRANEHMVEKVFKDKLKEYGLDFQSEYPVAGDYVDFAFPEHKLAIELKAGGDLKRYIENRQKDFDAEGWKVLGISTQEFGKYYHNFDIIIKRINRALEGIVDNNHLDEIEEHPAFFSLDFVKEHDMKGFVTALHVDVNIVENDVLDMDAFIASRVEYKNAIFVTNTDGKYICGHQVEKMSKSKFNVVNPDDMVAKYGADCFRMYEMFLGPIDQSKPWDTSGIDGVSKFLRRFWAMFFDAEGQLKLSTEVPTKEELKILHTAIKKVNEGVERFAFNTCVAGFMVVQRDLSKINCNKRVVLEEVVRLLAPFAPFITEELWHLLGHEGSVQDTDFPVFDESHLKEDSFTYPIQIGKKIRAKIDFPADATKEEIEKAVLESAEVKPWIEGKTVRKVVVVPKRMVNIVAT